MKLSKKIALFPWVENVHENLQASLGLNKNVQLLEALQQIIECSHSEIDQVIENEDLNRGQRLLTVLRDYVLHLHLNNIFHSEVGKSVKGASLGVLSCFLDLSIYLSQGDSESKYIPLAISRINICLKENVLFVWDVLLRCRLLKKRYSTVSYPILKFFLSTPWNQPVTAQEYIKYIVLLRLWKVFSPNKKEKHPIVRLALNVESSEDVAPYLLSICSDNALEIIPEPSKENIAKSLICKKFPSGFFKHLKKVLCEDLSDNGILIANKEATTVAKNDFIVDDHRQDDKHPASEEDHAGYIQFATDMHTMAEADGEDMSDECFYFDTSPHEGQHKKSSGKGRKRKNVTPLEDVRSDDKSRVNGVSDSSGREEVQANRNLVENDIIYNTEVLADGMPDKERNILKTAGFESENIGNRKSHFNNDSYNKSFNDSIPSGSATKKENYNGVSDIHSPLKSPKKSRIVEHVSTALSSVNPSPASFLEKSLETIISPRNSPMKSFATKHVLDDVVSSHSSRKLKDILQTLDTRNDVDMGQQYEDLFNGFKGANIATNEKTSEINQAERGNVNVDMVNGNNLCNSEDDTDMVASAKRKDHSTEISNGVTTPIKNRHNERKIDGGHDHSSALRIDISTDETESRALGVASSTQNCVLPIQVDNEDSSDNNGELMLSFKWEISVTPTRDAKRRSSTILKNTEVQAADSITEKSQSREVTSSGNSEAASDNEMPGFSNCGLQSANTSPFKSMNGNLSKVPAVITGQIFKLLPEKYRSATYNVTASLPSVILETDSIPPPEISVEPSVSESPSKNHDSVNEVGKNKSETEKPNVVCISNLNSIEPSNSPSCSFDVSGSDPIEMISPAKKSKLDLNLPEVSQEKDISGISITDAASSSQTSVAITSSEVVKPACVARLETRMSSISDSSRRSCDNDTKEFDKLDDLPNMFSMGCQSSSLDTAASANRPDSDSLESETKVKLDLDALETFPPREDPPKFSIADIANMDFSDESLDAYKCDPFRGRTCSLEFSGSSHLVVEDTKTGIVLNDESSDSSSGSFNSLGSDSSETHSKKKSNSDSSETHSLKKSNSDSSETHSPKKSNSDSSETHSPKKSNSDSSEKISSKKSKSDSDSSESISPRKRTRLQRVASTSSSSDSSVQMPPIRRSERQKKVEAVQSSSAARKTANSQVSVKDKKETQSVRDKRNLVQKSLAAIEEEKSPSKAGKRNGISSIATNVSNPFVEDNECELSEQSKKGQRSEPSEPSCLPSTLGSKSIAQDGETSKKATIRTAAAAPSTPSTSGSKSIAQDEETSKRPTTRTVAANIEVSVPSTSRGKRAIKKAAPCPEVQGLSSRVEQLKISSPKSTTVLRSSARKKKTESTTVPSRACVNLTAKLDNAADTENNSESKTKADVKSKKNISDVKDTQTRGYSLRLRSKVEKSSK